MKSLDVHEFERGESHLHTSRTPVSVCETPGYAPIPPILLTSPLKVQQIHFGEAERSPGIVPVTVHPSHRSMILHSTAPSAQPSPPSKQSPHGSLARSPAHSREPRRASIDLPPLVRLLLTYLLHDPRNQPRRHRPPALAHIEPLPLLNRQRLMDLAHHLHIISRHHHLVLLRALAPLRPA